MILQILSKRKIITGVLPGLLLFLVLAIGLLAIGQRQFFAKKVGAETNTVSTPSLRLPASVATVSGEIFEAPIYLNTDGQNISGIDVVLDYIASRDKITLIDIIPGASGTTLKTFIPADDSGNFMKKTVIDRANSTGKIDFGTVTFDWQNSVPLGSYQGSMGLRSPLAKLVFKANNLTGLARIKFTNDTHLVGYESGENILSKTNELTINILPSPTATPVPTNTPTPTPTVTPTPTPFTGRVIEVDKAGPIRTIGEALVLAAGATQTAPCTIFVHNGVYEEINLTGRNWVRLVGESRDGVVIHTDGLRTDIDPQTGKIYADIPRDQKDAFRIYHNMTVSNLTIDARQVKYCIHADAGGKWTLTIDNVYLKIDTKFAFGIGGHADQHIVVRNTVFEVADGSYYGIFIHNWNEQSAPTSLLLDHCFFKNTGMVHLRDLGSQQADMITLRNCSSDRTDIGIRFDATAHYWLGGVHTVQEVPYDWLLKLEDTIPPVFQYNSVERPRLLEYVQGLGPGTRILDQ